MALQCLSVKLVPDVSGRVCEPCRGNGSTEHAQRYATLCVCVCVCVKLGDKVTTTHGKIQQVSGDDAMSRSQGFPSTKYFLKAESLLKFSISANDHQQHGQVTTQHV